MKLLRIFPFLALLLLWSCGDQEKEADEEVVVEEEMVNPDEVVSQWEQAWSSNEPQNVRDQLAGDAVLVMNGSEYPKDSLSSWIDMAGSGMKDLNMTSLQKGSSDDIIYDSGTFSHGSRENDTLKFQGTYTFIWEKAEGSDEWKVALMDISDMHDEMTSPEED
ncbi:MAG: nuclear transport factor 2 family protein [Salinimicrobium sp.]